MVCNTERASNDEFVYLPQDDQTTTTFLALDERRFYLCLGANEHMLLRRLFDNDCLQILDQLLLLYEK